MLLTDLVGVESWSDMVVVVEVVVECEVSGGEEAVRFMFGEILEQEEDKAA